MKNFKNFELAANEQQNVIGGTKPAWAGKVDKSTWDYTEVEEVQEDGTVEIEKEYTSPWEGVGRKAYYQSLETVEG